MTPDTEVSPGQILAGKYRIESVLGRGGMGVVVAARHIQLEERVALKFLLPQALANEDAVRRFEREARAAVKIKSEHVARVIDVGRLESGSPYMVMEFLEGQDLGDYLAAKGPLPADEAVEYVLQASEALAEAHSMGIVHRDLKPANLFRIVRLDGTPSIKVLDFGISKVQGDHALTQTTSMMGSPQYMSPEQMTSAKTVDARTDQWSLGVILIELLTNQVAFGGDTIPEVCVNILNSEPPPLSHLRPDLPIAIGVIIERTLKKRREDRFANIAEFATALAPFGPPGAAVSAERIRRVLGVNPERGARTLLVGTGASADEKQSFEGGATILASGSTAPGRSTNLDASNTRPSDVARSRTPLLLGAVALAAVGVGGAYWVGSRPAPEAAPASAPAAEAPVPVAATAEPARPAAAPPEPAPVASAPVASAPVASAGTPPALAENGKPGAPLAQSPEAESPGAASEAASSGGAKTPLQGTTKPKTKPATSGATGAGATGASTTGASSSTASSKGAALGAGSDKAGSSASHGSAASGSAASKDSAASKSLFSDRK